MIDGPRGIRRNELDKLLEEVVGVVYSPGMRYSFPTLFCEENAEHLRVIEVDGQLVSHIGVLVRDMVIHGCRISVGNIGAVSTREDARKQGYAWDILEDAMATFRAEGVDMFLISGFRSLYRLHGATHVGKVARYRVTREMEFPQSTAKPFSVEDLPKWAMLHRSEPVRFHRPYDDFQKLLARTPEYRGGNLHSIWTGDCLAAYAVLGHRKSDDHESAWVNEYAGSRHALLGSVRSWCDRFGLPCIDIPVPMHDAELIGMLDAAGAEASHHSTGGTIIVLDFVRLCSKLVPLFEEIIGRCMASRLSFREDNGSCTIALEDEQVVFDSAHDVARLVFGNPADRDEQTQLPTQGRLAEALSQIFPVARPEYGLSYI